MAKTSREKPVKPYPEFPLTPHPTGRWCKKIRGKIHYFGNGDDPDGALTKYRREIDDIQAGRKPKDATDAITVRRLINDFLDAKESKLAAGELSPRTFMEYRHVGDNLADNLGRHRAVADLGPADFQALRAKLAKTLGPVALGAKIQRMRTVFKWGHDAGLLAQPVRFGPDFKKPGRKTLRLARHAGGSKMFEADELRKMVDAAGQPLRAMVLLALNGGFGNHDLATLPRSAVNLSTGWIDHPRPKTGVARRLPLWPETIEALTVASETRPEPRDDADAGLMFVTREGRRWVRQQTPKETDDTTKFTPIDVLSPEFSKLLKRANVEGKRRGFYSLRHVFRTIADASKDQPAVNAIMGHDDGSISGVYRERIDDERLCAVVDHVKAWLYPNSKGDAGLSGF
ncbi:MAG: tyrosine-type recombinase/integrase [Planctomycetota bacterium]|nr:tyrosine-type recombinase/integrase [Planctomycetaceae bacterium]MDQ3331075.1 tyrosine-type recombinase/integrase [Planctomycetota bacterium]